MAREASRVFGEVAEDYDRVRPGYPAELVDRVFGYGVPPGAALEVGAGTGKATVAFSGRGRDVTAIEPDPAMARFVHGARLVATTFEEYRPDREFALLYSADAWHWTDPATRWANAEWALMPGGVLALIVNGERVDDPVLRQSMVDAYAEISPEVEIRDDRITEDDLWRLWPGTELASQERFGEFEAHVFSYRMVRSAADQLAHLATRSQFRMLPAEVRSRLTAALAGVFTSDVPIAVEAVLYLARLLSSNASNRSAGIGRPSSSP
jgi:SAM-dependent methyltransferase